MPIHNSLTMRRRGLETKPSFPFELNTDSPQARGLAAWYPGSPSGGNKLFDLSGYGNHGLLVNSPTWTAGFNGGNSLQFNGTNNYVGTSLSLIPATASWSCSFWLKPFVVSESTACSQYVGISGNGRILVRINSGNYQIFLGNQGIHSSVSLGSVPAVINQWALVSITRSGVSFKIYVNGNSPDEQIDADATRSLLRTSFLIGKRLTDGVSENYWSGLIEDVRVYNRALTQQEVFQLYINPWELRRPVGTTKFYSIYKAPIKRGYELVRRNISNDLKPVFPFTLNADSPQAKGLVAWYPGEPSGGTTLFDLSGFNNKGSFVGGPTWALGLNSNKAAVAIGSGSSNKIVVTDRNGVLHPTGAFSLVAWIFQTGGSGGGIICTYSGSPNDIGFQLVIDGFQQLAFQIKPTNAFSAGVALNTWYLAVGTWDGATMTTYLVSPNGRIVIGTATQGSITQSGNQIFIGNSGFDNSPFIGRIEDVKIYNRAITLTEVRHLFNLSTRWDLRKPTPKQIFSSNFLFAKTGINVKKKRAEAKPEWPFEINTDSPQSNGLVVWYPGGPRGGSKLFDLGVYNNYGYLVGNPVWNIGYNGGQTIQFDGADDYVGISQNIGARVNSCAGVTLSCWVNYKAITSGQYANLIFTNRLSGNVAGFWLNIRGDGGSAGLLLVGGRSRAADSFQETYSSTVLLVNTWYHITAIFDFSLSKIFVYINDKLETSFSAAFGSSVYTHSVGSVVDSIGGDPNVAGRFFNGAIENFRIYNRALSPAEVFALYDPKTRWELRKPIGCIIYSSSQPWSSPRTWSRYGATCSDNSGPPKASDNVILEASSGDVTVDAASACRALSLTAGEGNYRKKLTHNAGVTLSIGDSTAGFGSVALDFPNSGFTYTIGNTTTSSLSFVSRAPVNQTISTDGIIVGNIIFNGTNGRWQLANHIVVSGNWTFQVGNWDSNGKTITLTLPSPIFDSVAGSFYSGTVAFRPLTPATPLIAKANIFENLIIVGSNGKTQTFTLSGDTRIINSISVSGNSNVNRLLLTNNTLGTQRKIDFRGPSPANVSFSNVDFRDMNLSSVVVTRNRVTVEPKPEWPFELNTDSQQAKGLVGWWPGEPAGDYLFDQSGRRNHGYKPPVTSFVLGKDSGRNALNFLGSLAGTISLTNPAAGILHPTNALTLSCWINPSSSGAGSLQGIIQSSASDAIAGQGYALYIDSFNRFGFAVGSKGTNISVPAFGVWYLLVGTWDGAVARLYVVRDNIVLSNTVNVTSTTYLGSGPLFGRTSDVAQNLIGLLEDIRIYNRSMSINEVRVMFNLGSRWELRRPIRRSSMFGNLKFDLSTISGGSGDCGGNSNMVFTPAEKQFWKTDTTGTKSWSTTGNWVRRQHARIRNNIGPKPEWPFEVNTGSVQAKGLIGWWPGTPSGGNKLVDLTGRNNHGILNNGPVWKGGKDGGSSLSFDGVDDFVSLSVPLGTVHTMSWWMWKNTSASDVILFGDVSSNYFPEIDATSIYYNPGSGFVSVNHGGISGQWYYVTIVRSDLSVSFYKNGVQIGATQTLAGNTAITLARIGSRINGTFWFPGLLEDLRIYNRALSPAEVYSLYNSPTRWELRKPFAKGFIPLYTPGRVPLPQDTAILDGVSIGAASTTIMADMPRMGSVDFTNIGRSPTFAMTSTSNTYYGSLTFSSGMTLSQTQTAIFEGRGSYSLTSAAKTFGATFTIQMVGGTLTFNDDFNSTAALNLLNGNLVANSNVTTSTNISLGVSAGNASLGSGTWTLSGASSAWSVFGGTVTPGTSTIKFTGTGSSTLVFTGGNQTYNNLWFSRGVATGTNQILGNNTFNDLKDDGTAAHTLQFGAGSTQTVSTFTVSGASASARISIDSTTTATHNLVKSGADRVSCDFLNIQHSIATPADTWYAGNNSIDNQSTASAGSGWLFRGPPIIFLVDAGAYTFTGTATNLLKYSRVSADPGIYLLAGTDVGLYHAFCVTASSGTFTETGGDASLLATRLISCSSGTYLESGTDASLLAARLISAGSGSYLESGTDTSLLITRLLISGSGTFEEDGTDVSFLYDRVVTANSGSILLSGTDAGLIATRYVSLQSGSFVLAGSSVTLTIAQIILIVVNGIGEIGRIIRGNNWVGRQVAGTDNVGRATGN